MHTLSGINIWTDWEQIDVSIILLWLAFTIQLIGLPKKLRNLKPDSEPLYTWVILSVYIKCNNFLNNEGKRIYVMSSINLLNQLWTAGHQDMKLLWV